MIEVGKSYFFPKSGRIVRAIQKSKDGKWLVERIDNGKLLIVTKDGLQKLDKSGSYNNGGM